ncbi:MAG: Exonuclease RNase and polymerase [Devosia sp.]|nr:Exonuclease RNase and polymerase [Devosia sp.]
MDTPSGPITFFDVETTGLTGQDRIVSLGLLYIDDVERLARGERTGEGVHLLFNPGRASHPAARKVHGYRDDLLALQDGFAAHADDLGHYFSHHGLGVAHNLSFDKRFIETAFSEARRSPPRLDYHCTMLQHRRAHGANSGLDKVLLQMGMPPRSGFHGALTDAWFAMAVFCWLHGWPIPKVDDIPRLEPTNMRHTAEPIRPAKAAVVAPASVAPSPPVPAEWSPAFAAAREALWPLATLLMHIAHADGEVLQAEVETISLLMHTVLAGTPGGSSVSEEQDLLASLVALRPNSDDLDRAAFEVMQSAHLKQAVAGWVRALSFADGENSPAENRAILDITERLRRARLALAQH